MNPRSPMGFTATLLVASLALSSALAPTPADAQGVAPIAIPPPQTEGKKFEIGAAYDHQFETDVDKDGDFSRDSVALNGRYDVEITDSFTLTPLFRWENHTYDFSGDAQELGFAWNNVNFGLIGLLFDYKLDSNWSLLGAPVVRYQGEAGADLDDSIDGGGLVGFMYHPSPRLQIGLLIGVVSALEEDLAILPIPMVRWQAGDEITLKLGIQPLGSRVGLGPELLWHPSKDFELGFGGVFLNRRFRLDGNGCTQRRADAPERCGRPAGTTAGLDRGRSTNGIGQDQSFPVYLRARWNPLDGLGVEAFGAVVLGGHLTVEEEFGNHIQRESYDPTGLIGVRGVYRF
ncbi:MAG: hypothetical protein ACQGVK_22150 [Myxococcota bacterium]